MKRREKKQYEAPRVKATHPKARLEQAVRPHGGPAGYFIRPT